MKKIAFWMSPITWIMFILGMISCLLIFPLALLEGVFKFLFEVIDKFHSNYISTYFDNRR